MKREILISKIHGATVTGCDVDYEGSITIDRELMKKADLVPYQKVLVANINNANRLDTYVIEGNTGEICLNGAAAKLANKGDRLIIMAFVITDKVVKPTVLRIGEGNQIESNNFD